MVQLEESLGVAKPREVFIALCLLLPIIGVGIYPKLAPQTYDVKTVAVAGQIRNVLPTTLVASAIAFSSILHSVSSTSVSGS